jgi:ABC-2 type transport system ATP-binding protein
VTAVLGVHGVRKRYGRKGTEALRGVDLEVRAGELVGLLGPNGAGKSTLTKIACGLVGPTDGTVEVVGSPAGSRAARSAIGYLAELFRYPGWASADEILTFHQRLARSTGGADERRRLLDLVGLRDAQSKRVEAMSKGMQQRLGVAQALVGSPRLLLLDEPTSALDPVGRRIVRDLLQRLRSEGVAVLLNSHLLGEVERVCDRVAILIDGRITLEGATADLHRPRGLEVVTADGPRLIEGVERDDVPRIVADLVAKGEQVYEVRILASTLEDVYMEAVEGRTG